MIFESLPVGPFQCHCMIFGCEETRQALVIDPGDNAEQILALLEKHQLQSRYLLHTHAHIDHIGATDAVRSKTGAKTALHEEDLFLCQNLKLQADLFGLMAPPVPPIDQFLRHGDRFSFGKNEAEALHTPGHTPGSVTFYIPEIGLLTGDTLFRGSIGRTDLWGGSSPTILNSIYAHLLPFPDDTPVYPGHGPSTTIGREKKENRFIRF